MADLAYPGTDDYSMAEFLAILLARESATADEVRGGGGSNQVIALAAGRLAQLTVSPNMWLFTGGAGVFNGKFDRLPLGTWDPKCSHGAECRILMMDVVDTAIQGVSADDRVKVGGSGFGGIQVDKYGNTNMIGIGGPHPKLKVRGPGTIGTIWMSTGPRSVFVEHHNTRLFVEKVEYRSGAGWLEGGDTRQKALGNEGPTRVMTPICFCDFTEVEHRMRLVSVHPGYGVDDVVANTGFELVIEGEVPTTTPPTEWELGVLRSQVDRDGKLKTRRLTVGI